MQAALVLLAVAGSTLWLARDASKYDWTDNGFAKNVASWVIGSLLLWPIVFPLYVFVARKKAPLKEAPQAKPEPVVAVAATGPSEKYGPSVDEVEELQPEPMPEPVVEKAEPVVELEPQPVVEIEPVEFQPEPVVEFQPEPTFEVELQPEPTVDVAPEPTITHTAPPETVVEVEPQPVLTPEPDPVAELEPEPVVESSPEPVAESESVLEISYPDMPVDEAPPGLSVDAFKDIKPVAFGGIVVEEDEPAVEPEPVAPPEPIVEPEPAPVPEFDLSYPVDSEPVIELEPEPEPAIAAAVAEEPEPTKKRGFRIPNPQLKLPSFGKKKDKAAEPAEPVVSTPAPEDTPKAKRGLKLPSTSIKLPQITLPPNLQGPLSDLERKIALGSVVAIVAAGAFGYSTAPSDEAAAPAPPPAPAAASR